MRIMSRDFTVIEEKQITSVNSEVYKIIHNTTGMNVLYLKNSDKNKVFCATFRTPPFDNSGAPHILEHCVLCGSEKYRVNDLFNELMKGSVNTYLNAMTFSDKTAYPVASQNDKDFFNLMDVYLDSVFNPLIHDNPEYFRQEGWNYRINKKSSPLEIRGIVYNEMRGAYDNPERLLIKKIDEILYKNTIYQYDSGGVPEHIPSLSFNQLVEFYDVFYSPSNCLLYLYGDLDINKALEIVSNAIAERPKTVAPIIQFKSSFSDYCAVTPEIGFYSVNKDKKDGSYFAVGYPACEYLDFKTTTALEILNYILAGNDAAPLRRAIRESGLCEDFSSYYRTSSYQTSISFVGKNCRDSAYSEFEEHINAALRRIIETGIEKEFIAGALNKFEFTLNEEDYGSRPKGLFYGISAASAWVYGGDVFDAINVKNTFSSISENAYNGIFESLIKQYLVKNRNVCRIILKPKKGLLQKEESALKERLDELKSSLSVSELNDLVKQTKALDAFRRKSGAKSYLNRIPSLKAKDIQPEVQVQNNVITSKGVYCIHDKDGIAYANLYFDLSSIPIELIPYCGLLTEILGKTKTASYTASQIIRELDANAGGIRYTADAIQSADGSYAPRFCIKIKALNKNMEKVLSLVSELIAPKLEVADVSQIIRETRLKMENNFLSNGHNVSIARALSYIFPSANYMDLLSGIGFYNELCLKTSEEITADLQKAVDSIFNKENLFIGFSSDGKSDDIISRVADFSKVLSSGGNRKKATIGVNKNTNEGFILDGGICFNAMSYNLYNIADRYSGKLQVAKALLNLNYLWPEIRNKGGAYGCGSGFNRDGSIYFYSYRDPELTSTYEIFQNSFEILAGYKAGKKELEKYIINAIKPFEKPLTPQQALELAVTNQMLGITDDMRQTERDEILSASICDINTIGETLRGLNGYKCSLGNKSKIETENIFTIIKSLRLTH